MPKHIFDDNAEVQDLEDRLDAVEYWAVTLLAAYLRANPDLEAAQEGFDTRPMPHPEIVTGTVRDTIAQRPDLTEYEVVPAATDEAEKAYRAVSRILERARALSQTDPASGDQEPPD